MRRVRQRLTDRGSGAIAVVLFALVVLTLAAFIVDGGLAISQRERAMDIAEQAARYAAQDLDEDALRGEGSLAPIDFGNCENRVAEYADSVGMGAADISASYCEREAAVNQVTVHIRLTYEPVFSGVLYSEPLQVWGEATAEAQTG